jgi:hypothetical protein
MSKRNNDASATAGNGNGTSRAALAIKTNDKGKMQLVRNAYTLAGRQTKTAVFRPIIPRNQFLEAEHEQPRFNPE